jgi:hypothetical protein
MKSGLRQAHAAFRMRSVFLKEVDSFEGASVSFPGNGASSPSARLEQDAQMFGLREREFPFSAMVWPQQMQTRALISAILHQNHKNFKFL